MKRETNVSKETVKKELRGYLCSVYLINTRVIDKVINTHFEKAYNDFGDTPQLDNKMIEYLNETLSNISEK